jgi:hypothetical protein
MWGSFPTLGPLAADKVNKAVRFERGELEWHGRPVRDPRMGETPMPQRSDSAGTGAPANRDQRNSGHFLESGFQRLLQAGKKGTHFTQYVWFI